MSKRTPKNHKNDTTLLLFYVVTRTFLKSFHFGEDSIIAREKKKFKNQKGAQKIKFLISWQNFNYAHKMPKKPR